MSTGSAFECELASARKTRSPHQLSARGEDSGRDSRRPGRDGPCGAAPMPADDLRSRSRRGSPRTSPGFERSECALDERRAAAVALAAIDDRDGRACFILTRRASHLGNLGGQWRSRRAARSGRNALATPLRAPRRDCGSRSVPTRRSGLRRLSDALRVRHHARRRVGGRGVRLEADPAEVAEGPSRSDRSSRRSRGAPAAAHPASDRPVISIPLVGTQSRPDAAILTGSARSLSRSRHPGRALQSNRSSPGAGEIDRSAAGQAPSQPVRRDAELGRRRRRQDAAAGRGSTMYSTMSRMLTRPARGDFRGRSGHVPKPPTVILFSA